MAMVQQTNVSSSNGLTIKEFLLAYALGRDPDLDRADAESAAEELEAPTGSGAMSDRVLSRLHAEIERHNDRTMTVLTRSGTETITRCGVCPKSSSAPCLGLRRLALPYAGHPAYQSEWHIGPEESLRSVDGTGGRS